MFDNLTMSWLDLQPAALGCLAVAISIYAILWYRNPVGVRRAQPRWVVSTDRKTQINAIPTVGGSSLPGLSYLATPYNVRNLKTVIEEGYRKARRRPPHHPAHIVSPASHETFLI